MAIGDRILTSKYNAIRGKVSPILGAGSGATGYNQALSSSDVGLERITELQWDNLRLDITKAYRHQNGLSPTITDIYQGLPIAWAHAVQYDLLADGIVTNKDAIYPGATGSGYTQQAVTGGSNTTSVGTGWNTSKSVTKTITFDNADAARFFFNTGGKINLIAGYTGTRSNTNDDGWINLVNSMNNRITYTAATYRTGGSVTTGNVFDATNPYTANYSNANITSVSTTVITMTINFYDDKAGNPDEAVNVNLYGGVNFFYCSGGEFNIGLPTVT